ncbi:MAG: hypothetical protein DME06_17340, partial [Candidatus Rokuibacteriota bacterium]
TCPLKYKYVHVLRVPILRHHTVAYGAIIHKAVEYYLLRRAAGNFTPLADLLDTYERAWAGDEILKDRPSASVLPAEGFLTREHEEARKAAGRKALTRFWHEEEATGIKPTHVEKEFGFALGNDKVRGRYDRVDEDLTGAVIIDYKTSEVTKQKDADRKATDSLQLKIYAFAWREAAGTLPRPTEEDLTDAIAQVKAAALGIRARKFDATPSYGACRYCAYNQVCPFTATRS